MTQHYKQKLDSTEISQAWKEAEKALEEQNKINKDVFIKLKEWLEKQNNDYQEVVNFIKNTKFIKNLFFCLIPCFKQFPIFVISVFTYPV